MVLSRRKRIALSILQEFGGELSKARIQNLLFLFCSERMKSDAYYEFIRNQSNPYSVQADEDRSAFVRAKMILPSDRWILAPTSIRYAVDLDFFEKIAIQELKNKWHLKSETELHEYVSEQIGVPQRQNQKNGFFTIGYEGASPEAFVNALIERNIKTLIDVRKNPFSRKFGFSKSEMTNILGQCNIDYQHMPELGIESEKRKALVSQRDYDALFKTYVNEILPSKTQSLDQISNLMRERQCIAITCFEAEPEKCHRSHVADALKRRADFPYRVEHIIPCQHQKLRKLRGQKF